MNYGKEQVLNALKAAGGRSLHLMEVLSVMEAPKTARDEVRGVLEQLKDMGLAKEMPGNRFRIGMGRRQAAPPPPEVNASARAPKRARTPEQRAEPEHRVASPKGNGVTGWLALTTRGFGFVTADDGGPDVFIGARGVGSAMHGDRVEVSATSHEGRREGEVLRVLARGLSRVGGTLRREGRVLMLDTGDPRLPASFRVVGTLPLETGPGSDVVAQVTRHPEFDGDIPEARVLSVLGPPGSARVEIAKILLREGVREDFPEDVLQDALGFPAEVPDLDKRDREDLRDIPLVTIDPPDARDHDDAVWAESLPDGGHRVIIAIADVSHYVRPGSAIDREALSRGCSIYLPGRSIPMLPPELSTNLASLVPDEDRLTLAVEVRLGKLGRVISHRVIEGVMCSPARITYDGAARALGFTEKGSDEPAAQEHRALLQTLHAISKRLRANRRRRGALEFDLPEAKVVLDERGEPKDVVRSRSDPGIKQAYEIVEDLMLLANEVVAEDLSKRKLPGIFRVHGEPDAQKVENFAAVAHAFGYELDQDAYKDPKQLQKLLARIEDTPHASTLGFLLLRAMQQASYDVRDLGHFALAARHYLHFTSPIRRYPDLAVHRVVRALARGERMTEDKDGDALRIQAVQSSRMERRAMTVEREVVNLYRCILMKDRAGEEFEVTITSVGDRGLYVALDKPFVEMRVPIERLGDDYFALDKLGLRLTGRRTRRSFAMGERVRVLLESINLERRELLGVPVGAPQRAPKTSAPRDKERRASSTRDDTRGTDTKRRSKALRTAKKSSKRR